MAFDVQTNKHRKWRMLSMKLLKAGLITLSGLIAVSVISHAHAQQDNSFTGTVERVWEDGFRLNTGDRTLRVDAWELCGDSTASHISVDDQLTVTGEFELGEFDAFSITRPDDTAVCSQEN
jgi:hypothetical protein